MLFHQVQGAVCVLKSKGIYKQVDVFTYGKRLFVKWGSGFIGLKSAATNNGTTIPNVTWEHIEGVSYTAEGFDLIKGRAA